MVGVDGTQGYGVGVGALGLRLSDGRTHLRDGAGDGGFLVCQPGTYRHVERGEAYFERGHDRQIPAVTALRRSGCWLD